MDSNSATKTIIYRVQLDETGYWNGNYCTIGNMPNTVEVDALPEQRDHIKQKAYRYDSDAKTLIFDEDKYNSLLAETDAEKSKQAKLAEIDNLKAELSSTDYKVIKCAECSISGEEMPYDVETLHKDRQALRDKINQLEASIQE